MSDRLNLLFAFPYIKKDVVEFLTENKDDVRFLLDSGAFTAWKAGEVIEVGTYCKFLDLLPVKPWRYFMLDVVGNPEKTMENYEAMLRNGYCPIPVFTRGEDISALERYYEKSDLVGIGGLVGTKGNTGFVKGIMDIVKDRRVHWLGFGKFSFIKHFKPYSCDSSSWSMGLRFGERMDLFMPNGEWIDVRRSDFIRPPSLKIIKAFEFYEEDYRKLGKKEHWRNLLNIGDGPSLSRRMTFKIWSLFSIMVEKKTGSKFFLASSNKQDSNDLLKAFKFWKGRGF